MGNMLGSNSFAESPLIFGSPPRKKRGGRRRRRLRQRKTRPIKVKTGLFIAIREGRKVRKFFSTEAQIARIRKRQKERKRKVFLGKLRAEEKLRFQQTPTGKALAKTRVRIWERISELGKKKGIYE